MSSFASLRFLIPKVMTYVGRELRPVSGAELDLSGGEQLVQEKNPDPRANQRAAFRILTNDLLHELMVLLTLSGYEVTHLVIAKFPEPNYAHPHDLIFFDLNIYGYETTFAVNDLNLAEVLSGRTGTPDTFDLAYRLVMGLACTPRFCAMQSTQLDYALPLPASSEFAADTKILEAVRDKKSGSFFPKTVVTLENQNDYQQPYYWLMLYSGTAAKTANDMKAAMGPITGRAAEVLRNRLRVEWEQEIYHPDAAERKIRVGLLSNLPPYSPWETTPEPPSRPTNLGDPLYRFDSDANRVKIWTYAQKFWGEMIRLNFPEMLDWIYKYPLSKFLPEGKLPKSGLTEGDIRRWLYELALFVSAVEDAYKAQYGTPPPDFIRHRILGFNKLTWFEILVFLHELNLIDWLGGVNTRLIENRPSDGQPVYLRPIIEYDVTGFYHRDETIPGDRASTRDTLQINQAGKHLYGHWQRRISQYKVIDQFERFTFRTDNITFPPAGTNLSYPGWELADLTATRLESEETITAELKVYESDNNHFIQLLLLPDRSVIHFKRAQKAAFLSDEVLASLPEEIRPWREIQERIPFHPDEQRWLDKFIECTLDFAYKNRTKCRPQSTCIVEHIIEEMWRFGGFPQDEGSSYGFINQSEQLSLVQYYLTSQLQALPPSKGESLYPWEALLSRLNHRLDYNQPFDHQPDLMAFLQITEEDLEEMRDPEPNFIYAYTLLGQQQSVTATPVTGISYADAVQIQVMMTFQQTLPPPDDPSIWNNTYYGTLYGGAGGPSTPVGIVFFKSSGILEARTQWLPQDFIGPIALHSSGLTLVAAVGFSFNFYSRLHIWGSKPGNLTDDTWVSFSWLAGGSAGVGVTLTWGLLVGYGLTGGPDTGLPGALPYGYIEENSWKKGDQTHFSIGSPLLTDAGKEAIAKMVVEFRRGFEGSGSFLEISGFASPSAGAEFNMTLSHRRAQSVFNYIYQLLGKAFRIPTNNIIVRGYGETPAILIGNLRDGEENAEWRRVDIRLNGILVGQVQGD